MSINALNSTISAIRTDGHISAAEAATLTSPQVLGAYTNQDEFERLGNLARDIEAPNAINVKPVEKQSLVKRGVKIAGAIGGTIGGVAAVSLITWAVAMPLMAPAAGFLAVFTIPAAVVGIVVIAAFVGTVIGFGALGGYIHSKVKGSPKEEPSEGSVTADAEAAAQIKKVLDKGITAEDPVKKGMKIGGIVGGVLGGLGLGTVVVGSFLSVAMLNVLIPVSVAVLAVAGLSVGIGALVGSIQRKNQED
jgi:hypothetical protein